MSHQINLKCWPRQFFSGFQSQRSVVIAILAIFLAIPSVAAGNGSPPPDIDPLVFKALKQGPVRVLVQLRIPGGYRREARLSPDAQSAQRSSIRLVQKKILDLLKDTDFRPGRRFSSVPSMSMEIGPLALSVLEGLGEYVRAVRLDAPLGLHGGSGQPGIIPPGPGMENSR